VDWVRAWAPHARERLIEIAKTLRKFPWMVEVVRQRPMNILHPYTVEVYVTKDGSEVCLSLNPPKAFCARNGAVKETKLELEFSRYETLGRCTDPRDCWYSPRRRENTRRRFSRFSFRYFHVENLRLKLHILGNASRSTWALRTATST
jgi:hypothetical protein